jgi:pyruvate dehydrogenase E2 component (dihydrolipoamide acetyltransferase)
VNIGVAVAVEGLLVVCRMTASRSSDCYGSTCPWPGARQGKVRPTTSKVYLSISNLGMFDVEDFIAIINPPEKPSGDRICGSARGSGQRNQAWPA